MPQSVVLRANEILHHLKKDHIKETNKKNIAEVPKNNFQLSFFDPVDPKMDESTKMADLDVNPYRLRHYWLNGVEVVVNEKGYYTESIEMSALDYF
jgi:hypothetical protein